MAMDGRAPVRFSRSVHPLSHVRAARGWTYQDVVDVVARRVGNAAARREKAWRWEHAGVVPDLDSQRALAAELGITVDRLLTHPWPHWLPTGDPVPTSFTWDADGSLHATESALEHAMLDRRGFTKLTGTMVAGLAEEWLKIEPPQLLAAMGGGRIGTSLVERLEEGVPRLRLLEAERGGERARRLIDAELGIVTEVVAHAGYSTDQALRLHALSAELGRMAGWASFDAGMHAAAQRYWVCALHHAHTADRRDIGANILKSMSLQCYDFHELTTALALARSARAGVGETNPRTEAMLALREARAHAALGNTSDCDRLITAAETTLTRSGVQEAEPEIGYFDEAEFNAQVATCWLDLGRTQAADDRLARALTLFPTTRRATTRPT